MATNTHPSRAEVLAFLRGAGPLEGRHFGEWCSTAYWWRRHLAVLEAPIPMVLHCPRCGTQHIDEPTPEWPNPPHRSHMCQAEGCGTIWRPADVPTVGVAAVTTSSTCDNWPPPMQDEGDVLATEVLRGFASRDIKRGEAITAADIEVRAVDVPLMYDGPVEGS